MTERKRTASLRFWQGLPPSLSFSGISFCLISIFFLALLMRNSKIAISYVSEGLSLCAKTLIPSLFPFMVLSDLLVSCGMIRPIGRLLARPFRFLFGIGGEGAGAVLLGFLCGFPLGAKTAVSLYRQGRIQLYELQRLMTFCNVPSFAFLVFAVGESLLGNQSLGIELYGITLLSALLIGMISKRFFKEKENDPANATVHAASRISPLTAFTDAVASSASAMLRICAFVLFFSALTGVLERACSAASLSAELTALFFGSFELTGGVARAAVCSQATAPYVCAALAGWSGLSVHFQIISLCDGVPFPTRSFFLAKAAHGLLNVLLLYGYTLLKSFVA